MQSERATWVMLSLLITLGRQRRGPPLGAASPSRTRAHYYSWHTPASRSTKSSQKTSAPPARSSETPAPVGNGDRTAKQRTAAAKEKRCLQLANTSLVRGWIPTSETGQCQQKHANGDAKFQTGQCSLGVGMLAGLSCRWPGSCRRRFLLSRALEDIWQTLAQPPAPPAVALACLASK
jgi:hypothetical protein